MVKILVIGDIMMDRYTIGTVDRISPEAPVPIVKKTKSFNVLGGCGNVIRNLAELDCKVYCKTIVGLDYFGEKVKTHLLNTTGFNDEFVETSLTYQTTVKNRIIADYRFTQMLRVDDEVRAPGLLFTDRELEKINLYHIDIIIISDYDKGVVNLELMDQVRALGIPFIIDPKPCNLHMYCDAYAITPNEKEYNSLQRRDTQLVMNPKYYIKTMGAKGIRILNSDTEELHAIVADPIEVFNVSGAGDTVISVVAYCIAKGNDINTACHIANECAHYVVTKTGTSVVPTELFNTIYLDNGGV